MGIAFTILFVLFLGSMILYFHERGEVYIATRRVFQIVLEVKKFGLGGDPIRKKYLPAIWWISGFQEEIRALVKTTSLLIFAGLALWGMWGKTTPRAIDGVLLTIFLLMSAHWAYWAYEGASQAIAEVRQKKSMRVPDEEW